MEPAADPHRSAGGVAAGDAGPSDAALMQLLAAGTVANAEAAELTTAVNLANNVHEATLRMPYEQGVALDGASYSAPVDSRFKAISELGNNWAQQVNVTFVNPDQLAAPSGAGAEPTARVSVVVSHNNKPVYTTSWVVAYVP